jgi:ABC-2 type transport system permease protein
MKNSRLRSLIRKEFIQIRRDPRTLALIILIPVIQLFLLGYAATNDVRNVSMAVYDLDRSPSSRELLEAYQAADYFVFSHDVSSEEELRDLIEKGEARLGMIIPPDFGTNIKGGGKTEIAIVLDGSDPSVASTALSAAQLIGQAYGTSVQVERLRDLGLTDVGEPPLEVRTQVWYNPNLEDAYFMVPGIVGMVLFAITSIVTANAIVRERERGTIEQLIVTPIRPWELIIGKMTPYVILALFNTVEVLAIGSLWFGVPIRGSMALILALSSLFLLSSLGIGLLASSVANTQQEAMLTVYLTLLPSIFLSGFFFPLEAMPKFLQLVSYAVPLRYYLSIIRALLLKGVGIAALQQDVIALAVFGAFLMVAASLRFRKRLD